jgi:hypothetical protein
VALPGSRWRGVVPPGTPSGPPPWRSISAEADAFIAAEEAEAGMKQMSEVFRETGGELYMGAGGREHD